MSEPGRAWTNRWRTALLAVGVVMTGLVVREIGPAQVSRAILSAWRYLPLLVALEAAWMGMDVFVLRALLGESAGRAPGLAYARSAATAYAVNVFFPAGRASAEVTRATMLSPWLGAGRATVAALQLHGVSLLGTASISLCALAAVVRRPDPSRGLALALAGSALLTGALGGLVSFGARAPRLWTFLGAHSRHFREIAGTPTAPWSRLLRAVSLSFAGRSIQSLLFTVAVAAATGALLPRTGLLAQGISLAGSTFGDAVPQQAGVSEGAFLYFAGALDLAATPARAVAIALLVRVAQLSLAVACLVIGLVWKERGAQGAVVDPQ